MIRFAQVSCRHGSVTAVVDLAATSIIVLDSDIYTNLQRAFQECCNKYIFYLSSKTVITRV